MTIDLASYGRIACAFELRGASPFPHRREATADELRDAVRALVLDACAARGPMRVTTIVVDVLRPLRTFMTTSDVVVLVDWSGDDASTVVRRTLDELRGDRLVSTFGGRWRATRAGTLEAMRLGVRSSPSGAGGRRGHDRRAA